MKVFLNLFMKTKFYRWLLMKIVPYIRFSLYYTKLRGWQFHQAVKIYQPGDILLSVDKKKLTSLLIPGVFTHASFAIAKNAPFEVAEMTHANYSRSCLFDIFKEADRVVILRPEWDEYYRSKAIEKCLSLQNATYDVSFSLGIESLYCSELVYQSDFERRLKFDLSDLAGLGRPYLSPDGIYDCGDLTVIFDSDLCIPE
jgi:hypothetical protein